MRVFGHRLFPIVVLALLGIGAYWNSLHAPFVFDDLDSVQRNRLVHFVNQYYNQFSAYPSPRSILFLTFAFNNWLNEQNPLGYHIVNLVLHILNGFLVFAIARRIYNASPSGRGRRDSQRAGAPGEGREFGPILRPSPYPLPVGEGYALIAAAFFLVHPIQTESVTYISSRSELLSTMAYLGGMLSFMWIPEQKIGFFASLLMLLLFALGFGFKETVVTFPAAILLYDYWFVAKANIRALLSRWRFYLSFVVVGAAGSYWLLRDDFALVKTFGGALQAWHYFLTQFRVIARYIRLLVFPSGLNLDYDFPMSGSLLEPATLLSFLMILFLAFLGWKWRNSRQIYSFSILWFFLALSPTSSIIPIPDVIFEHRVYLPLVGVCLSFPFAMEWLVRKGNGLLQTRRVMFLSCLVLAVLMVATIRRNDVWSDEVRLFSDVVAKSPHKLRPYENLVFAYMKRGQEEQALAVAKMGVESVPEQRVSLLDTIGNLYLRLGKTPDAIEYFKKSNEEAVRLGAANTFLATSFNNLGVAYLAFAKTQPQNSESRSVALRSAREAFQKSLDRKPDDVGVIESFVNVNHALNEGGFLETDVRRKLQLSPNDLASLYMLASLLSLEERYMESLEYFRRAEEQGPFSEVLSFNYAFALSKTGQIDRAIEKYLNALRVDPIFTEAHYNLALLFIQKTDYTKSMEHLTHILNQEPGNARAHMKLAEIYAYQRQPALARQHLHQILQANPQDAQALSLLEKIGR